MSVTALGSTLRRAYDKVSDAVEMINFKDIGAYRKKTLPNL
ncbi:MAG: hypothetical protein MZV64_26325 [Ignavibacteriales bacterium]|nr:hypothetical protein [Ignavibacteriales bacterium]